jgi:hypothetical protein
MKILWDAGCCMAVAGVRADRLFILFSNLGLSLSFAQQRDTRYGDTRYKIKKRQFS